MGEDIVSTCRENLQLRVMAQGTAGEQYRRYSKGVFANQMKTVFSNVMESDYVSEDGDVIDAIFSTKSINARVVLNPLIIGTTNTLLNVITERAIRAWRGQPNP